MTRSATVVAIPLLANEDEVGAALSGLDHQLRLWQHAVQLQSLRVQGCAGMGYAGKTTREADVFLFAVALSNCMRAATQVCASPDATVRARAEQAVAEFDEVVQQAAEVREVVEHLDDYLAGRGQLQQQAASSDPLQLVHEADTARHTVDFLVAPKIVLTVDVERVTAAAVVLAGELSDLVSGHAGGAVIRSVRRLARGERR
jgi:hypothetical protein